MWMKRESVLENRKYYQRLWDSNSLPQTRPKDKMCYGGGVVIDGGGFGSGGVLMSLYGFMLKSIYICKNKVLYVIKNPCLYLKKEFHARFQTRKFYKNLFLYFPEMFNPVLSKKETWQKLVGWLVGFRGCQLLLVYSMQKWFFFVII